MIVGYLRPEEQSSFLLAFPSLLTLMTPALLAVTGANRITVLRLLATAKITRPDNPSLSDERGCFYTA
ncbi:uncharacterized protein BDW43DRAFT_274140 [Aspergillus alliaceus]|uniref:uncharacterized protein n=1 Tax=Petromyces alliaceus TaxID=209559 RepID=UPI0012A5D47E|nr:uncharacterized protein BDW43DRAFT_274140 [Aspergillus alliaceus]KAB8234076.1 hypothetical protein BDW43DRAFT_274140 [Aspergillus alliaceus]